MLSYLYYSDVSMGCTPISDAFADANGNITEYVNSSGVAECYYIYDAFGNHDYSYLGRDFNFRFSTKYFDDETDLYYYGYRFYRPELGRWLSRDPIEERGGNNLYGFVNNDAINLVDADGRAAYSQWKPRSGKWGKVDRHYEELKKRLERELKSMCPENDEMKWDHPAFREPVCCKRETCLIDAKKFAVAYVTAIKEVWSLEKLTHGFTLGAEFGNIRLTMEKGRYFGDQYDDAFLGHGLRCDGWAQLGCKMAKNSIGNPVNNCFFGKRSLIMKTNASEKERGEGDNVRHARFILIGPSSSKILDPWPSAGWEY